MVDIDLSQFFEIGVRYTKRKTFVDQKFAQVTALAADLFVGGFQKNMHRDSGDMAESTHKEQLGPLYYAIVSGKDYWKYENARSGNKTSGNAPIGTPHEFVQRTNAEVRPKLKNIFNVDLFDGFKKVR